MEYYRSLNINDLVAAIYSKSGEILYLVEGKERALLIDTCLGVGHLKDFVGTLTRKPLTVLISHGHVDHALGAPEFEDVYMSPADIPLYRSHCPLEVRKGYIAGNLGPLASELTEEDFVPPCPDFPFRELKDGMVFDLGEAHVEVYSLPGHTAGTHVFLIREYKILILGDACNNMTFLFGPEALTVEEYQQNLLELQEKLAGRYSRVFLCHRLMEGSERTMEEAIRLCDEIKAGNVDDIPFSFRDETAFLAKRTNARMERVDGGFANIVYRKDKIWKA